MISCTCFTILIDLCLFKRWLCEEHNADARLYSYDKTNWKMTKGLSSSAEWKKNFGDENETNCLFNEKSES